MVSEEHFEGDCLSLDVVAGVLVRYEGQVVEDLGGGVLEVLPHAGAEVVEEVVDELLRCEGWILVGVGAGSSGEGAPCKRRSGGVRVLVPHGQGRRVV